MIGNALQFIHRLIVQYCESPVSSPITWCLGIIWIIKSIHALYKMKVKTDELVAEKEAKEVSEAIKDLDILTEKSKKENQDIRTLMFENLKELKEFYVICKQQIRKSFSAAMFSCFAGFMLFVLAVIIFLLDGNNSASFMAGLSGAIVEIVSSRLCGDTYHGICKALHAAELVHTLPAGYFDLSGLWYAQCYHDYISFRFC